MKVEEIGGELTMSDQLEPPAVPLAGADGEAAAFADFLASPRGQQVFAKYGFVPPAR